VYLRAIEPSVVVALRRRDLEQLILTNTEVGLRLVRLLSERLHETETRLAELSHKDVPARLASQVLRLIESEGVRTTEGYEVPTHYTHEQLATMIGSKRVPVSWAFAQLKEEGAVELRDRKIHVADLEVLKRAAEV
jgi:CRP/FNR family cyclic AMP-dependent transcriptional regulator